MRAWPSRIAGTLASALAVLCLPAGLGVALDRGADGDFEKRTSSHFVLYQDVDIDETSGLRGSRRFEQQVLEILEAAHAEADARLGLRPERPITVILYDPAVFDAEFAGLFRFPVAGFYGGTVHVRGDARVHERLVRVLHHEYVHAAFAAEAGGLALPAWLNEGVAEWFEARAAGERKLPAAYRAQLAQWAAEGRLASLSELSDRSFARFGPEGAQLAYLQSRAFIDHLSGLRGERALRDWVREIVRTGDIERATRRTFRRDLAHLYVDHLESLVAAARRR